MNKHYLKAVIAVVLLLFYCYLILKGVYFGKGAALTPEETYVLTLINGIVTSLVIAELAIADRQLVIAGRMMFNGVSDKDNIVCALTNLYVYMWLVFGLIAFLFGYLYPIEFTECVKAKVPCGDPTVVVIGKTFLGLVVGATYALFGVKPRSKQDD